MDPRRDVAYRVIDAAPAIQSAIDAGGQVTLDPGDYYCETGLIVTGAPVCIAGAGPSLTGGAATRLIFPPGVDGLTIGDGSVGPMMSEVRDLDLTSTATTAGPGCGIVIRSGRAHVERVSVRGFASHGVLVDGTYNASLSRLEGVVARRNLGDGIHADGSGGGACTLILCDAVTNGGWGFWIGSNGNLLLDCHTSTNTGGAFYDNGLGNSYLQPYVEQGVGAAVVCSAASAWGHWVSTGYASTVPLNLATAGGGWRIEVNGGTTRQIAIDPPGGYGSGARWILDSGVYDTGTFRLRAEGVGDVLRTTSTALTVVPNAAFSGAVAVSGKASADLLQVRERDNPGGIADTAQLFARANSLGRTELCVRFGQGAVHILATEDS